MEQSVTTIQCQNLTCLAPNAITNKFCEKCGTPLVKRYLWMSGDWVKTYYQVGELLEDRYLVKQPQIVLDLKPALAPQAPDEFPSHILPYLKLFSYRLHVPQVYGYIPAHDERMKHMDVWFLEYGSIPSDNSGELLYPQLLPQLTQVWDQASPMRQLNWLWQMARLWQPFVSKGVVSSLFNPSLLRVNNRIIQLLELQLDNDQSFNLGQLGQLWSEWLPQTSASLRSFLEPLCQDLQQGKIEQAEQVISLLDQALLHYGQTQQRTYQIFTCTDTGPMREHNEDACYPPPNQAMNFEEGSNPLAIVCDGIGGQEGGEIASNLAIETLQKEITRWSTQTVEWNPLVYCQTLERAINTTNNAISERNDHERRTERQRMGTTLVMSLAHAHEIYIAHVGDSRVYWITSNSCHQVTVDDDLASREVRLGYLLYRDAVQYPNAGALVQALGMSNAIHPSVQRLILDEDCVFLLCSDGLSDYDRVEQYWESELVPLLTREKEISEVGQSLLNIANQKNGHDNSTIALVYCQVQPSTTEVEPLFYEQITAIFPSATDEVSQELFTQIATEIPPAETPTEASFSAAQTVETPLPPPKRSSIPLGVLVGLSLGVLGLVGLGVYVWQRSLTPSVDPLSSPSPSPSEIVPTTASPSSPTFTKGDIWKVKTNIQLQESLEASPNNSSIDVPANSLMIILERSSDTNWVNVVVCSPSQEPAKKGWLEIAKLQAFEQLNPAELTSEQKQNCQISPATESPTPNQED